MKIYGNLSYESECWESYCFRLDPSEWKIKQIKETAEKVKELGAYEVSFFDYSLDVLGGCLEDLEDAKKLESEEEGERLDTCILHVSDDCFRYSCVLKHGTVTFDTGWINLSALDKGEDFFNE